MAFVGAYRTDYSQQLPRWTGETSEGPLYFRAMLRTSLILV
jgi:hypothetical protein